MKTFGCSPGSKKPSLPDLYRAARGKHSSYLVNDNVRELIRVFNEVTYKKHRTSGLGVLSHMAKESLRVPKSKQYRRDNLKIVQKAKATARHSALFDKIHELEEGL